MFAFATAKLQQKNDTRKWNVIFGVKLFVPSVLPT